MLANKPVDQNLIKYTDLATHYSLLIILACIA